MPTKVSRMPGGWASPRFPPWWSIDATWSTASPTSPAPSRASTPTGARSHEPPAGIPTLARHRRLVAAERGHVDVRPGHRHHRLVGAVPRLPRIPRGRNLLLAVLHALRLLGSHLRQSAPLRPRCGRSEEHTSELQQLMRISYPAFC